ARRSPRARARPPHHRGVESRPLPHKSPGEDYGRCMSKTVQIRDLDDAIYAGLSRRAADGGTTVPELLRAAAAQLAAEADDSPHPAPTPRSGSTLSHEEVLAAIADGRHS